MTKRKANRHRQKATAEPKQWPAVVSVVAFVFGMIGYAVVGEIVLSTQPHPVHWLTGLISGVLGLAIGWACYRWKGDII